MEFFFFSLTCTYILLYTYVGTKYTYNILRNTYIFLRTNWFFFNLARREEWEVVVIHPGPGNVNQKTEKKKGFYGIFEKTR